VFKENITESLKRLVFLYKKRKKKYPLTNFLFNKKKKNKNKKNRIRNKKIDKNKIEISNIFK